jgi:hypothetical protein
MVKLLRQLINCLSDTVGAWEKFQRKEIWYFIDDVDSPATSPTLKPSVNAVDDAFLDLKELLEKLRHLEKELCQDNPQGVSHISILM